MCVGSNARFNAVVAKHNLTDLTGVELYSHGAIVAYRTKLFDEAYALLGLDGPAERQRRAADREKWRRAAEQRRSVSSMSGGGNYQPRSNQQSSKCCC